MSKSPVLTFSMELKGLDNILKGINKSQVTINDKLNSAITDGLKKYKEHLKELKINPIQPQQFHDHLNTLKSKLQEATKAKIILDTTAARKNLESLKTDLIALVGSVAFLKNPISSAIDFESNFADVKKVVDFKDNNDIKNFQSQLKNLSREIPLSLNELAQITASGGQLGIAKDSLMDFTATAAKMGVAFDMSAKQAGDSMATLMNVFNLNVKQVSSLGDTINHISNNSAAKATDITNALARVAGNAKDFGLSADATAGLTSAFIALGKAPEVASTAINSMLTTLNNADKATGSVKKAFEALGISGKALKKEIMQNPQQALTNFLHTLSKLPKKNKTAILTDLFGKNFSDDISLLTGAIENYDKAMNLSNDSKRTGSMQDEFKARSETTANNIQLMKNAFNEIGINIGSVFLPVINTTLNAINKISYAISAFTEKFPNLTLGIFSTIAAITALKAAFILKEVVVNGLTIMLSSYKKVLMLLPFECLKLTGSLNDCNLKLIAKNLYLKALITTQTLYQKTLKLTTLKTAIFSNSLKTFSISGFINGIKSALVAFRAFSLALLTNPIGLVITALSAAAFLIYKYWDRVKAFFSGFFDGLKQGLAPVVDAFSGAFNAIKTILSSVISLFSSFLSQSEATKESLIGATNAGAIFGKAVSFAIRAVLYPFEALANILNAIGLIIEIVKLKFSEWIDKAKSLLNEILEFLKPVIDMFNTITDGIKSVGDFIGNGVNTATAAVKDTLGIGDGKEKKWYNPFSWANDKTPKNNTKGAIDELKANKAKENQTNTNQNTINDNKTINITMQNSNATPAAVAKAVKNSSYSYGD
ncbi:phage tail tape measure protein [Campylobacter gastrosuis]|uniref:Phage tail tape measure protein n=1 Tax=Campylobacter gastrosuis TaxID=2974576 RepID=A0ABT7HT30_9BACT|nr:phage tail tape measure protein [Campylobacter gastrosuis]MDL0089953.1 phage tail tape measure protein [Campylobacter gastrosuis]